jgi:hypothetical protein
MSSTPFTSCSIGVVTVCSTTSALAPGKARMEIAPMITITMETTIAKIGR